MIIPARFYGVCVVCQMAIVPGDFIAVVSPIGYRHADCAPDREPLRSGRTCPTCNVELPLSGVCDEHG